MTGRERAQESLANFADVIVAKSKESILDYSFPLIHNFLLLLAYILSRH